VIHGDRMAMYVLITLAVVSMAVVLFVRHLQ
jgi:hypothetical protein